MKKLFAVLAVVVLATGVAFAAENIGKKKKKKCAKKECCSHAAVKSCCKSKTATL
jgi:hypothetical protein